MRLSFALLLVMSVVPLYAQTSGPSGIQGVESDEFSPAMKINGITESEIPLGGIFRYWHLRSFVNKNDGTTDHQLYVSIRYSSSARKKSFNLANDDTATELNVRPIWSESQISCLNNMFSSGCSYAEDIGIDVTAESLRAHAATGYRIKVTAKNGDSFIVAVSPAQIAAQLSTAEKCLEFVHAHGHSAAGTAGTTSAVAAAGAHSVQLFDRSQLGFKASEVTDEIAAKTGLRKGPGIVVFEVSRGSIAERAGLKVLDRIMAVAGCGKSMDSQAAMRKCLASKTAYLGMVVDRGGKLTPVGMKLYAEGEGKLSASTNAR